MSEKIQIEKLKQKKWEEIEFNRVDSELRFMKGKILTIIDALGLSEQQNKATKDLIHEAVGSTINRFWRHTIGEDIFPKEEIKIS